VLDQQTLDGAAAGHATTEQARGEDSGVVDDDEIAGTQQLRQRGDPRVRDDPGFAVEVKQTGAAALRGRLLGDELRWKFEVEVADIHVRS
jgi:hypothetical protein